MLMWLVLGVLGWLSYYIVYVAHIATDRYITAGAVIYLLSYLLIGAVRGAWLRFVRPSLTFASCCPLGWSIAQTLGQSFTRSLRSRSAFATAPLRGASAHAGAY